MVPTVAVSREVQGPPRDVRPRRTSASVHGDSEPAIEAFRRGVSGRVSRRRAFAGRLRSPCCHTPRGGVVVGTGGSPGEVSRSRQGGIVGKIDGECMKFLFLLCSRPSV